MRKRCSRWFRESADDADMPRVLVLFPNPWDRVQLGKPKYRDYELHFEGDDFFKFPGTLKLITFDACGYIDELAEKWRGRIDGVLSTDEYVGAIIAAGVAQKLGLPGGDPARIIEAQHKYYSRLAQQRLAIAGTPEVTLIPISGAQEPQLAGRFPLFVKPVKGTFSLFAELCADFPSLTRHLDFGVFERLALRRVTKPFNDLLRRYTQFEHDANWFVGESPLSGDQVTVDGFVDRGRVQIMGIVDSVMFEGTQTFERFEYPSRLPPPVQARMVEMTERFVAGLGIPHGQFNVELFYDRALDRLAIIEINPRLSYQFADLYEYVDGSNTYDVLLDLTLGRPTSFAHRAGEFKKSASFVLRTFRGRRLRSVPSEDEQEAFRARYQESTIKIYGDAGASMKSEMRAMGSYRYGIINVAANSLLDLFAIREDAIDKLPFEVE
jgi:hypothetical protein